MVRQRGVLCRGATVYAASRAQTNIRRSLRDANLFAAAMASHRCVCCKAHLYLQIGYGQSRGSALPRRYSICGKHSAAEYTRRFMHLNRNKTQTNRRNTLRNFLLQGFNKHIPWFRCGGKGKHLNLAARQNQAANQLTTNVLQNFQQQRLWFRSQRNLECHRMQIRHGSTSGRGIHQTRDSTAQASEPE